MSAYWRDPEINLPGARRRGRPVGPKKVKVTLYLLPETAAALRTKAFALSKALGEAVDWMLGRKKKNP